MQNGHKPSPLKHALLVSEVRRLNETVKRLTQILAAAVEHAGGEIIICPDTITFLNPESQLEILNDEVTGKWKIRINHPTQPPPLPTA